MSLLLEALKKAEKAKEEAQRRAKGEAPAGDLRLEVEPPAAAEAKHVLTRPELPDIRQPLEILTEEITPKPAEARPTPEPAGETAAENRAAARKVFEAKFREPNPKLPFYMTLGLLGVMAVGIVGYFWYQLRPAPPLVNASPPRGQELAVAPTLEPRPAPTPAPSVAAISAIPGLPTGAPTASPSPRAAPEPAPPAEPSAKRTPAIPPASFPAQRLPVVQPQPTRGIEVPLAQTRQPPQVHPRVESAYAAYLAGDIATARADYQVALREDSSNRDAVLGLAAVDVRSGRYEPAEAAYLRLLQSDPTDSHAQAALIALRASRLDPLATESRVKTLLAADPGANVLHFTLGNQLAQQGRWAEAQQEFFKAFAAEPDNPDFAFNLAVSLDHLRQPKLALEYYRRAVALAEKRGASFDLAAARQRTAQLAN